MRLVLNQLEDLFGCCPVPHALINIVLPSQGILELLSYPLLDTWYCLIHTVDT